MKDHPEWFFKRPDGTIKYAENPPKKYQDVYPLNFQSRPGRRSGGSHDDCLLCDLACGFSGWTILTRSRFVLEWLIAEIHEKYPDAQFLSEALHVQR